MTSTPILPDCPACKRCWYWLAPSGYYRLRADQPVPVPGTAGTCHKLPPTHHGFPAVADNSFCGEFVQDTCEQNLRDWKKAHEA